MYKNIYIYTSIHLFILLINIVPDRNETFFQAELK